MTYGGMSQAGLADDFYRLSHDDRTGEHVLDDEATRIGLASALLAELCWLNRINVVGGLLVAYGGPALEDDLAGAVLYELRCEPTARDVGTWLRYLALGAYDRVAARLVLGGHLRPQESRKLFRRVTFFVPTDSNRWAMPQARLTTGLGQRRPIDPRDVHLLGIAEATGLLPKITDWGGHAAHTYCTELLEQAHPLVRALIQETKAHMGTRVLSGR